MKLILDSEGLNANCNMTDLKEVFSEQPLSNGPIDIIIKNGDMCNGNSKVTEENGSNVEKDGNNEPDKIVDEKVECNDKNKIVSSVISAEKQDEESDSTTMKQGACTSPAIINEVPEIINKEETLDNQNGIPQENGTSELQENHMEITKESIDLKEIPTDSCEIFCSEEKVEPKEPTDDETKDISRNINHIPMAEELEPKRIQEFIFEKDLETNTENEPETLIKDVTIIEKESLQIHVNDSIDDKKLETVKINDNKLPDSLTLGEITIDKEAEAMQIDEITSGKETEATKISETTSEKETNAVKIIGTIIEKKPEPILEKEAESTENDSKLNDAQPMKIYDTTITKESEKNNIDETMTKEEVETIEKKPKKEIEVNEEHVETDVKRPKSDTLENLENGNNIEKTEENETHISKDNSVQSNDKSDSNKDVDYTVSKSELVKTVSVTTDNLKDVMKKGEITEAHIEVKEKVDNKKSSETGKNKSSDIIETAKLDETTPGLKTETISQKLDEIQTTNDIPAKTKENVVDMVYNSEDSSDGCTIVETNDKLASPESVEGPLDQSESKVKKSGTDVPSDVTITSTLKAKTISGLSNTLDIISDDEEETPSKSIPDYSKEEAKEIPSITVENKCINLDDDDDIMVIDDVSKNDTKEKTEEDKEKAKTSENDEIKDTTDSSMSDEATTKATSVLVEMLSAPSIEPELAAATPEIEIEKPDINEKTPEKSNIKPVLDIKPLVPANFLKTFKTNLADMTRDELEEFCLVKIVEGIVEKSNLSEIKVKLKTMNQNIEEWRKKAMVLSKQNRDLQIVLKTVQEEQRKRPDLPITPLKITRSVGMQVFMSDTNERGVTAAKRTRPGNVPAQKQKVQTAVPISPLTARLAAPTKPNNNATIPVPRLVPAAVSSPAKTRAGNQIQSSTISSNTGKASPANNIKTPPIKSAEKRPLPSGSSPFTVDLTDDEPPAKQTPTRQVRLVSQQQLMGPRALVNNVNSPRKVYIPINSQNQGQLRPANAVLLKSVTAPNIPGPRQRPPMVRLPNNSSNAVRPVRTHPRHPAPLPDVAKQQQLPNWKGLPPTPDLKISKVENGIVISWKIEGYQDDSYEEIASYQLYAYQETSSPPSTLLWKKIGDVKALPLPMACTLTQFMAGYKYYFAVRAVDIRSRIGPFSLPGSILLLNK